MSGQEGDSVRAACIAAVLLALDRADVPRQEQPLILAGALEELSLREQIDEVALLQMVNES